MNKQELIDMVSTDADITKAAAKTAIESVFEHIQAAVASGQEAAFVGFGTFKSVPRAARTGRNPQTGAAIEIAASNAVKFNPSQVFKDKLNPKSS